jgi:ABC-type protease/lipase transport system fused ATPase/permease subunit
VAANQILSPEGKQFRRLGGLPLGPLQQAISLEKVSLHYAPELEPALSDISLFLPKGQMLGLVGPSGAGKSSIADLLTGPIAATGARLHKVRLQESPNNAAEVFAEVPQLEMVPAALEALAAG